MTIIGSRVPETGFPPNCVGASPMTKYIAMCHTDEQRADAFIKATQPEKSPYTLPIIGIIGTILLTGALSLIKFKH